MGTGIKSDLPPTFDAQDAVHDGTVDLTKIPEWEPGKYKDSLIIRRAVDPVGRDPLSGTENPPSLEDATLGIIPDQYEELDQAELSRLWQRYNGKFDGIYKSDGFYYFWKNPASMECETTVSPETILPTSLNPEMATALSLALGVPLDKSVCYTSTSSLAEQKYDQEYDYSIAFDQHDYDLAYDIMQSGYHKATGAYAAEYEDSTYMRLVRFRDKVGEDIANYEQLSPVEKSRTGLRDDAEYNQYWLGKLNTLVEHMELESKKNYAIHAAEIVGGSLVAGAAFAWTGKKIGGHGDGGKPPPPPSRPPSSGGGKRSDNVLPDKPTSVLGSASEPPAPVDNNPAGELAAPPEPADVVPRVVVETSAAHMVVVPAAAAPMPNLPTFGEFYAGQPVRFNFGVDWVDPVEWVVGRAPRTAYNYANAGSMGPTGFASSAVDPMASSSGSGVRIPVPRVGVQVLSARQMEWNASVGNAGGGGGSGRLPGTSVGEPTPGAVPGTGGIGTFGKYTLGSAVFLGGVYALDQGLEFAGVSSETRTDISAGVGVGGVGYGFYYQGSRELIRTEALATAEGRTLATSQKMAAGMRGVGYVGGGLVVGAGTADLAGTATDIVGQELGLSDDTRSTLNTGATVVGGIGGGAAFVATVEYLSLSTPVTAIAALGIYGACEIGSYLLKEWQKSAMLDRSEEKFRFQFEEKAAAEPGKGWGDVLGIFDEMKTFFETALINPDFGAKEMATLRKMAGNPNFQAISRMMGWWFDQKYFKPFETRFGSGSSIREEYGAQAHDLFLELKFPGLSGIVHQFQANLTTSMTEANYKALRDIVSNPANAVLFDYAGDEVIEEVLDPFLNDIGYYGESYFGAAYDYVALTADEKSQRQKTCDAFGRKLEDLKSDIESPYMQPEVVRAEAEQKAAQTRSTPTPQEYAAPSSSHAGSTAIAAPQTTVHLVTRPKPENGAWYQQRAHDIYTKEAEKYLEWTGAYDETFFTQFPHNLKMMLLAMKPENTPGGYDGVAWLKFYILKEAFSALKTHINNLKSNPAYEALYGDFSSADSTSIAILVTGIFGEKSQIEERFDEFLSTLNPSHLDGVLKDLCDSFDVIAD